MSDNLFTSDDIAKFFTELRQIFTELCDLDNLKPFDGRKFEMLTMRFFDLYYDPIMTTPSVWPEIKDEKLDINPYIVEGRFSEITSKIYFDGTDIDYDDARDYGKLVDELILIQKSVGVDTFKDVLDKAKRAIDMFNKFHVADECDADFYIKTWENETLANTACVVREFKKLSLLLKRHWEELKKNSSSDKVDDDKAEAEAEAKANFNYSNDELFAYFVNKFHKDVSGISYESSDGEILEFHLPEDAWEIEEFMPYIHSISWYWQYDFRRNKNRLYLDQGPLMY